PVQLPGAGPDRIDRSALPNGTWLANAYGHEVGIAEYVIGAMLTLTRDLIRIDGALRRGVWESQWAVGAPTPPAWPELAGKTLGITGYGRSGHAVAPRARAYVSGRPARPRADERAHDATFVRRDRGHAGGAREGHRREHRARHTRRAAGEPHRVVERRGDAISAARRTGPEPSAPRDETEALTWRRGARAAWALWPR